MEKRKGKKVLPEIREKERGKGEMRVIELIEYKDEMGNPQNAQVGRNCTEIIAHPAEGEGDKWFWDIIHPDGTVETIFYPTRISSREKEEEKDELPPF